MTQFGDLLPGDRIEVRTSFVDYDGRQIAPRTRLELVDRKYFAHDDGYTFRFAGGEVIRLTGDIAAQQAVLENVGDRYFVRLPRLAKPTP